MRRNLPLLPGFGENRDGLAIELGDGTELAPVAGRVEGHFGTWRTLDQVGEFGLPIIRCRKMK